MKPLQKFWDDTMLLRMLLKLVEHFEVLLVNRLVGGGREVNVLRAPSRQPLASLDCS